MPFADEDRETVAAIDRGEPDRFRELVERHGPLVLSVLRRVLGDVDLAEELAQETFVRAWSKLGTFRGECRVRTWLVQIALNLARDRLRARVRGPKILSLEEATARGIVDRQRTAESPRPDSPRAIAPRELEARLERAIRLLPPHYREAFVLRHVEDLSYEEMARVTGQSVGSLKVRVHRARTMLREHLSSAHGRGGRHGRLAGSLS